MSLGIVNRLRALPRLEIVLLALIALALLGEMLLVAVLR